MLTVPQTYLDRIVRAALDEDAPQGDLTSQALLPPHATVHAELRAREPGILCGEHVFHAAMAATSTGRTTTHFHLHDCDHFTAGTLLATIDGNACDVLTAERVALNFTQRLSGIATITAQYVAHTHGTTARIVDSRKTTPGLRLLERYAVRCGGAGNHRYSLSDAVLVKDNHLQVLAENSISDVTTALLRLRERVSHTITIEVEVDRLDQIEPVLAASVDTILLDNFTPAMLRTAVRQIAGRARVEASGGVHLATVREIALTGVDLISVGALTHSIRALDLGLDIHPTR